MKILYCFLLCVPFCMGQVFINAPCPNLVLQPAFDVTKYVGLWYQQEAYPFIFTGDGTCVTAEYSPLPDNTVLVNNTKFDPATQQFESAIGQATIPDPNNPASLCVTFEPGQSCGSYNVVSTDYIEYTLIHACTPVGNTSLQTNWILTRDPNPPASTVQQVKDLAAEVGLDPQYFIPTLQNCY